MILYLSSQKFGNNETYLKEWINNHNNKVLLIFNALEAKGKDKITNNVKEYVLLLEKIGFDVTVIDLKDYFDKYEELKKLCREYNSFCVMGENVFVLILLSNLISPEYLQQIRLYYIINLVKNLLLKEQLKKTFLFKIYRFLKNKNPFKVEYDYGYICKPK